MKQQKCNYFPSLWWRGREKGLSTFLFLLLFSISLHASVRIFYSTITGIPFFASGTGRHPAGGLAAHLECTRRTAGKIDYKRGIGNYEKALYIRPEWKGKRLFFVSTE